MHTGIFVSFLCSLCEFHAIADFCINSLLLSQIHLGEGVMCSKYAYQNLITVKEHSEWAVALLIGVYGDKAQNMRYGKPRSPDLQSFSACFVNVAKCKYIFLFC